jgi:hypothetical protein
MSAASNGSGRLLPHHLQALTQSAISDDVIRERGYWSATKKAELEELGFGRKAQRVPSLVIPIYGVTGELEWSAHRPDSPRVVDGKPRKYEIPFGARQVLDVPRRVRPLLRDPRIPVVFTEGPKKVDAALSAGVPCIGVFGTYAFRGTDADTQGKVMLGDWEHIALKNSDDHGRDSFVCFDSDVMRKPEVQDAMDRLSALLHRRGATVAYIILPEGPNGTKIGLDDFLAAGHTIEELWSRATTERPRWLRPRGRGQVEPPPPPEPKSLADVGTTFQKWLYLPTMEPVWVLLGAIAANRLPGEPVWLMIVGASGGGKSELIRACNGLPDVAVVTKLSEAGLLSGTSAREALPDATGGVLRQIGALGILSFKDFTSVLSADRDALKIMLGALREIYDGFWSREVGSDGGRQLVWTGKAGLVAGVTPAIDRHHVVISEMGERLVMYRLPDIDSESEDLLLERAMGHAETLDQMRQELGAAVAGLFEHVKGRKPRAITQKERNELKPIARFTAQGRAAVFTDNRGDVVDVGQREVPARLIQQAERLLAGLDVIGVSRETAWHAVLATMASCIPDGRRRALAHLYDNENAPTRDVSRALSRPLPGTRYALQGLEAHGLVLKHAKGGNGNEDSWDLTDSARKAITYVTPDVFHRKATSTTPPPVPPGDFPVDGAREEKDGEIPRGYGAPDVDVTPDDDEPYEEWEARIEAMFKDPS